MRKVLSFVLVLALVLSSFSMAFAADTTAAVTATGLTDIAGNKNVEAIQVSYDLGIVKGNPDGTFLPDKTVNRAEFAAMITRALNVPDSALAGYTATTFKDTAGYGWAVPYLAFCQTKGILLGDGAGNVMPGKTINMNEAITMSLRAIGYTANSALLVGAWPSNYVSIAQNYGLYDDVAKATDVTKAMSAQIIYNLLTVQKVVVNADGDTNYLWADPDEEDLANLLNTNLECKDHPDVILGDSGFDYDTAIINITDKIGAFGTAYTNEDKELVAFVVDSTALTGKISGDQFKVGDTKYDFGTNEITTGTAFINTVATTEDALEITKDAIASFAAVNSNDEETVTLNVELSGKKIKDIYSVVGWLADDQDLAPSDVQEDITDDSEPALLTGEFATDDNDAIDMTSFSLKGVASLDKIAKDDVVYIYTDKDKIRKVEVGTETVTGTVEETDSDTATIGGKDYDLSPIAKVAIPADIDVDSEGTFYLDVNGDIFDFDGTNAADTFGVIKAFTPENSFDNYKIKLYKSDDSTKSLYFSDSAEDMDWNEDALATDDAIVTGALIGYSLNADGDIDSVDTNTSTTAVARFQSAKVVYIDGDAVGLASNAVVFTYKTTWGAIGADDFDMAKVGDIAKGAIASTTYPAAYMLNSDGDVSAMFIEEGYVDVDDTDVYGVLNTRTNAKSGDEDVYKYAGFIDGTAFTKKTDDKSGFFTAGNFDVYKITVDTTDVITGMVDMDTTTAAIDVRSGWITKSAILDDVSSDRTVLTAGTEKFTIADDAVVYKYSDTDEEFTVSKLSALKKKYTVSLYDTEGEDCDGIADLVIYMED